MFVLEETSGGVSRGGAFPAPASTAGPKSGRRFRRSRSRASLRGTLPRPDRSSRDLGRRKPEPPVRPRRRKTSFCERLSDPQTDVAPGRTRGRNVRSKNQCSMCPAIHTKSRSWLRSSSTREPSDPLLRVVIFLFADRDFSLSRAFEIE